MLPEDLREDYLARHELADLTPMTVTDPRELRRQLVSEKGIALDSGEYQLGVTCLSAAVRTAQGAAAVAVSAPMARQSALLESMDVLRRCANRVGLALATP